MEQKNTFKAFKLSKVKIIIFAVLFLFVSLVPVFKSKKIQIAGGRAQPAVIYLLFFIGKLDERTSYAMPTSILYGSAFLTAYALLYMFSCISGEILEKLLKKKP